MTSPPACDEAHGPIREYLLLAVLAGGALRPVGRSATVRDRLADPLRTDAPGR